ncbi:cytochrome P450 6a8 isoform X1 [Drosophila eugracilis]|uniref:cytochrome P450 6a8 isoform X1 n=1 Tax=Drosophila eugracilis TaxID=29029 RepID=UPI001BD9FB37|nr:cytochrome P450 6a8 isoform X1 [Drosophila eugracilis]
MALTYILFQVAVALLAIVTYYLHRKLTYFKRRGIPFDTPHPIRGNLAELQISKNFHECLQDHYNKFRESKAPFVGFYLFQNPAAFVMDLELAKHILIKDFSNFSNKGMFYNEKDDPISAHLFNLDGPQWRLLRNKLSSTFTSGKMKFMFPTVVSVADEFMTVMHEKVSKNDVLNIRDLVARFTVDVIGTCAFGIKCNSLRDEKAEFLDFGKRSLVEKRHGTIILGFMRSYPKLARKLGFVRTPQHIQDFYRRIVTETVAMREKENIKRNDFMDMLIEMKNQKEVTLENGEVVKGLTIDEVLAQAFVFFIAGFETSSSTMGYALYELAKNPDIQNKVRAEVEEVLEQHDQKFTYECTKDLKYLNQVISETLRLYTIVPNLDRMAAKRYVVPGHPEFVIEAGQSVIIPASAIHRDPSIYPEPLEFRPERFTPEEIKNRPSVAWLPFGDGPRNCIGLRFGQMQARIGLALLIKNFKFSTSSKTSDPLVYDPKSFVLGLKDGIYLKLEAI